ncbi:hypothetical protein [Cognatiyoonia sp. IB215182]|uniref:hypothetical protein n=1 Tax=Cognatiyoonia sp. IB215182 TaxID=3097353 RepID=UPI0039B73B9C
MHTQWDHVVTMIGVIPTGLNYSGVDVGLRLAGIDVTPALWRDVQLIERGALAAVAEVRA